MLLADYGKHVLLPEKDFADFKRPPRTIPESIGHHAEWLRACKTGAPTTCPFSYSGLLTEANHLGNVAYRGGKRIEWDAKAMRIRNNARRRSSSSAASTARVGIWVEAGRGRFVRRRGRTPGNWLFCLNHPKPLKGRCCAPGNNGTIRTTPSRMR